MPIALHDATVATYRQILPAMAGLIDKAQAHCQSAGLPDNALTEARLAPDMWTFAKQIQTVCHHSAGGVEGILAGEFGPDLSEAPTDFASLKTLVAEAMARLDRVSPEELEARAEGDVVFRFGERRMDFTTADFVLSFSLPNFWFHASAAYAILRAQGVALGKMDFLGRPRMKMPA